MQQQDILLNGSKAIVAMVYKKPVHEVTKEDVLGVVLNITKHVEKGDNTLNDTFTNLLKGYLIAFDELDILEEISLLEMYSMIVQSLQDESEETTGKALH